MSAPSTPLRIVVYQGDENRALPQETRFELLKALLEKGYAVSMAGAGGSLAPVESDPVLVLGSFEGGPPEIEAGGLPVYVREIGAQSPDQVLETVAGVERECDLASPGGWKPWFPVIDYGRCTNCMQCLSFCLFGVYGVSDEKKLQVQNPHKCKTDCPACSRVCPEVAILFPKYRAGPINGDEVSNEDLNREKMKIDISSLLGGDIYKALRERSLRAQSRFSKERDEERALKERQRCLRKLQEQLDIPAEALQSLPSLEEIEENRRKAMRGLGGPNGE